MIKLLTQELAELADKRPRFRNDGSYALSGTGSAPSFLRCKASMEDMKPSMLNAALARAEDARSVLWMDLTSSRSRSPLALSYSLYITGI